MWIAIRCGDPNWNINRQVSKNIYFRGKLTWRFPSHSVSLYGDVPIFHTEEPAVLNCTCLLGDMIWFKPLIMCLASCLPRNTRNEIMNISCISVNAICSMISGLVGRRIIRLMKPCSAAMMALLSIAMQLVLYAFIPNPWVILPLQLLNITGDIIEKLSWRLPFCIILGYF